MARVRYIVLHTRVHRVVSEIGVDKCFEPTTNAHAWLMPRMLCSVIVGSGASRSSLLANFSTDNGALPCRRHCRAWAEVALGGGRLAAAAVSAAAAAKDCSPSSSTYIWNVPRQTCQHSCRASHTEPHNLTLNR
jgi:hypothetical protein